MLQAPSLAPALVLGLGMAGCVTGAPAPAPDHKTAIYASCAVTARPAAGGLIVEGRFTADVATRGRFELNILDSGAGGIARSGRAARSKPPRERRSCWAAPCSAGHRWWAPRW